jgi:hypothetical protein
MNLQVNSETAPISGTISVLKITVRPRSLYPVIPHGACLSRASQHKDIDHAHIRVRIAANAHHARLYPDGGIEF